MGIVPEQLRMIEANAAIAIEELSTLSERSFGFDEDSVAWVEGSSSVSARKPAPRRAEASSTCSAATSVRRSFRHRRGLGHR